MLEGRHFLCLADLDAATVEGLVTRSAKLAEARDAGAARDRPLASSAIALVFEKPSTRTRVAFEVAAVELGGAGIYLDAQGSQLGRGEPIEDTARVLSSYCRAIVYRTFGHERVTAMASASSVPVINGLTDWVHPCQLVADLATVYQEWGRLDGLRYAWIGDGNNMAHSWLHAAGLLGLDLRLACPDGYRPDPVVVDWARARMAALGRGSVEVTTSPAEACVDADVVSTDVWASMGQEEEAKARQRAFVGYCVDDALLAGASAEAIVLHCLPAHRGEEISAEVLEGSRSRVFRQAGNRLHAHTAILEWCLRLAG